MVPWRVTPPSPQPAPPGWEPQTAPAAPCIWCPTCLPQHLNIFCLTCRCWEHCPGGLPRPWPWWLRFGIWNTLAFPHSFGWHETTRLPHSRCSDKISISQTTGDDLLWWLARSLRHAQFSEILPSIWVLWRWHDKSKSRQIMWRVEPCLWSTGNAAQLLCVKSWRTESEITRNRLFQLLLIPQWPGHANPAVRTYMGRNNSQVSVLLYRHSMHN